MTTQRSRSFALLASLAAFMTLVTSGCDQIVCHTSTKGKTTTTQTPRHR